MGQTSATNALLLFRKKLEFFVDPFYDTISSLGNGIVRACQSCEKEFQKNFNPNTKNPDQQFDSETSPEQQRQENFNKAAQNIAYLYENNCTYGGLDVSNEDKQLIYDNALHLYEKIGEGSDDEKERKLITLLHRHRVASINNILKDANKNEEEKLGDINKILNDSNYYSNLSLDDNIFWLAQNINKSTFLLGDQSNISEKASKEELLFRLNDFGYSCLGVIESGAEKSHKIQALEEFLMEQQPIENLIKEHSNLKSLIRKKIEKGVSVVFFESFKIDHEALKLTDSSYQKKTEEEKATCYNSFKNQLLDQNRSSIIVMATDRLRKTKSEVGTFEEEEQVTKRLESLLNSKAEIIAESGIKNGIDKMPYSLMDMDIDPLIDSIKTAMYNEAFFQISFAKGRELVEKVRKMKGGDVTPPSQKIQPRAQLEPSIPAPRRP